MTLIIAFVILGDNYILVSWCAGLAVMVCDCTQYYTQQIPGLCRERRLSVYTYIRVCARKYDAFVRRGEKKTSCRRRRFFSTLFPYLFYLYTYTHTLILYIGIYVIITSSITRKNTSSSNSKNAMYLCMCM